MSLKEAAKEERKKFKEIPGFKKKIEYIWDYYRFLIIGTIVGIAVIFSLGSTIYHNIKFKEVFCCVIINNYMGAEYQTAVVEGFFNYYGINPDKEYITIDDSFSYSGDIASVNDYASLQKIGAMISARMIDCMIGDKETISQYAIDFSFYDLETILPADLYEAISDSLCWFTPLEGGEARPYAIDLSSSPFKDIANLYVETPILGVVINSEHLDAAIAFIRYAFNL